MTLNLNASMLGVYSQLSNLMISSLSLEVSHRIEGFCDVIERVKSVITTHPCSREEPS